MVQDAEQQTTEKATRYRAPALEKGLDILELLAGEQAPLTISMMGQRLGRSMSELFRMVQVLEYRGFIRQSSSGEGFVPTDKLFALGMEQAPVKNLLEIALPVMRDLSATIGQSCHLAVRSGSDIVVVARVESSEKIGFSVRIGYREKMILTGSGAALCAFQQHGEQKRWLAQLLGDVPAAQIKEFQAKVKAVLQSGYAHMKSEFVDGVMDLSAPILRGEAAVAALTVPFVQASRLRMPMGDAITHMRSAAEQISSALLVADQSI